MIPSPWRRESPDYTYVVGNDSRRESHPPAAILPSDSASTFCQATIAPEILDRLGYISSLCKEGATEKDVQFCGVW